MSATCVQSLKLFRTWNDVGGDSNRDLQGYSGNSVAGRPKAEFVLQNTVDFKRRVPRTPTFVPHPPCRKSHTRGRCTRQTEQVTRQARVHLLGAARSSPNSWTTSRDQAAIQRRELSDICAHLCWRSADRPDIGPFSQDVDQKSPNLPAGLETLAYCDRETHRWRSPPRGASEFCV